MEPTKTSRELGQEVDDYLAQRYPDVAAYPDLTLPLPLSTPSRAGSARKARKKKPTKKPASSRINRKTPSKKRAPSARKARPRKTKPRKAATPRKAAKPRKKSTRQAPRKRASKKRGGTRKAATKKKAKKRHRAAATVAPPPPPSAPPASALSVVLDAVRAVPSSGRFGPEKVFISEIYDRVDRQIGMTLEQFKRWLLDQNREQHLDLVRADSQGDMPADKLERSEIRDRQWGGTFHFVLDRSQLGRRR